RGYAVHLSDVVPLHVEQAREASARQPDHPLAGTAVGDARRLAHPDGSADAVLLLGPLYHLTERADRLAAWREARRGRRPGRAAWSWRRRCRGSPRRSTACGWGCSTTPSSPASPSRTCATASTATRPAIHATSRRRISTCRGS